MRIGVFVCLACSEKQMSKRHFSALKKKERSLFEFIGHKSNTEAQGENHQFENMSSSSLLKSLLAPQAFFFILYLVFPSLRSVPAMIAFTTASIGVMLTPCFVWLAFVRRVRRALSIAKSRGGGGKDESIDEGAKNMAWLLSFRQRSNNSDSDGRDAAVDPVASGALSRAFIAVFPSVKLLDTVRTNTNSRQKNASSVGDAGAKTVITVSPRFIFSIVRRAVVVVGGDFARSPRMQYHATSLSDAIASSSSANKQEGNSSNYSFSSFSSSLASAKLFDEVLLVGYDCGNALSEQVQQRTAATDSSSSSSSSSSSPRTLISLEGLFPQPSPPTWLTAKASRLGGRRAAWAAGAIYKVLALSALLVIRLPQLLMPTIRVNTGTEVRRSDASGGEGGEAATFKTTAVIAIDVIIPQLVLCQTPPAIPFLPIIRFIAAFVAITPDIVGRWAKLAAIECGVDSNSTATRSGPQSGKAKGSSANNAATMPIASHMDYLAPPPSSKASVSAALATPLPMWLVGYQRPLLAVDWHNFGYSIMATDRRPAWMVGLYRALEGSGWCRGHVNLTVSEAMKGVLTASKSGNPSSAAPSSSSSLPPSIVPFGFDPASVTVLHDHSPSFFRPRSAREVMETALSCFDPSNKATALHPMPKWVRPMFEERARKEEVDKEEEMGDAVAKQGAAKGEEEGGGDAPPVDGRIIIASTSWTADDDYTIVINALKKVDEQLVAFNKAREQFNKESMKERHLWFVATGKGVARARFEAQVEAAAFSPFLRVTCIYFQSLTAYATMLSGCDAGLSLHYSSSGLDLPMKCVDMLGAGVPVLSFRYPAIGELVDEEGRAGWLFSNEEELASSILEGIMGLGDAKLNPFSDNKEKGEDESDCRRRWEASNQLLATKREYVRLHHSKKWDEDWTAIALPTLEKALVGRQ